MNVFKILIVGILSFTLLTGCALSSKIAPEKDPLIGTWKTKDYFFVFEKDHIIRTLDINKKDIPVEHGGPIRYETIDDISPHELYFMVEVNGKKQRIPVGIYKIENGKLIIGKAIEKRKEEGLVADHVDGSAPEPSELEAPPDFNGEIIVFDRIDD